MGDVTALLCSSPMFWALLPAGKNDGGPKDSADHREGEACGESENTPNTGILRRRMMSYGFLFGIIDNSPFLGDNSPFFRDNFLTFGDFSGII